MPEKYAGTPGVVAHRIETSDKLAAISSVGAAWLLSIGIDVFLHGGLLAHLYVEPSPFLLPAEDAFRRIPLGYLTFLILTGCLFWLVRRLQVRGFIAGFRLAAVAGAVVWGALVLGLHSISTANLSLLAGWWIGQTVELAFAGGVLGAAANRVSLKRVWAAVGVAVVALAAATVALQSLGFAPAMKVVTKDGTQIYYKDWGTEQPVVVSHGWPHLASGPTLIVHGDDDQIVPIGASAQSAAKLV